MTVPVVVIRADTCDTRRLLFHDLPNGDNLLIRHGLHEIDAVGVPGQIDLRGL